MTHEAARALAQFFEQMAKEHPAQPAPVKPESPGRQDLARLTVVAGELGICERTVDRWAKSGVVTLYRHGRLKFVDRGELRRALAASKADASPASPDAWAKKKLGQKK